MDWWDSFKEWFLILGDKYHVNPFIFGGIYLGAIPFFFLSIYWTIKNSRNKKSIVFPALLTALFFISAYLYLLIVGENIPIWVYFFIGIMVLYGIYSTINKVKKKTKDEKSET
jgi:ABC-type Co2+ transport system permease subunit